MPTTFRRTCYQDGELGGLSLYKLVLGSASKNAFWLEERPLSKPDLFDEHHVRISPMLARFGGKIKLHSNLLNVGLANSLRER
jgi:hypothetical protein